MVTAAPPTRVVVQQPPVRVCPSAESVADVEVSIEMNVLPLQVRFLRKGKADK